MTLYEGSSSFPDGHAIDEVTHVDGIFVGEMRTVARILRVHGGLEGIDALSAHEGTCRTLVAAAEHAFAEHAGNGAGDLAHRLQFRPRDLVIVPQPDAILAEDRADGLDVAGIPRVEHPVEALLRVEDVFQTSAETGMRRAVSGNHAVVQVLVPNIGKMGEAELLAGQGDEFLAFRAANFVRRSFQAGPHGAGIEADEAEVDGVTTEGRVMDNTVFRIVKSAHAGTGEIDHERVEFPAGRADVVVFDGLSHADDLHAVGEGDGIYVQEREQQVDVEGCRAGHAAAGDVAIEDGVEAAGQSESFPAQDEVNAVREAGPGVGNGPGFCGRDVAELEIDDAIVRKVRAKQAHTVGVVWFVGEPEETVGADAKERGAVVVAMLDTETEARRRPPNRPAPNVKPGVRGGASENFSRVKIGVGAVHY